MPGELGADSISSCSIRVISSAVSESAEETVGPVSIESSSIMIGALAAKTMNGRKSSRSILDMGMPKGSSFC